MNHTKHETLAEQLQRIRERNVIRSREQRIELGEQPAQEERSTPRLTRPFFCRTCGKETVTDRIPEGWYTINRHTSEKSVRLGVYCSIECFIESIPRLRGIDHDLTERGVPLVGGMHPPRGEAPTKRRT